MTHKMRLISNVRNITQGPGQRTLLQWQLPLNELLNTPSMLFAKTKEYVMFKTDEAVGILKRLDRSMTYVSMRPLGMSAVTIPNASQSSGDVTINCSFSNHIRSTGSLTPYGHVT